MNEIEQKAIETLRESFLFLNKDLVDKIAEYKKTKSFSGYLGDNSFDFKDFFEVLEYGFKSLTLKDIFESMMHLYFFKGCCDFSFDINKYIDLKNNKFNEKDSVYFLIKRNKISKKIFDREIVRSKDE